MTEVRTKRSFLVDFTVGYALLATVCAILKLSMPLWGKPVWLVGSLSWWQIAIGPAIASGCASGSDQLADYFTKRLQRRRTTD